MIALLLALVLLLPSLALAEEAPALNSGDTAWMLTATALVLFMTIPGLSLFYGGMVRSKNILSVLMQCFAITSLMTILWVLYAYSIAFGGDGPFWGGLNKMFLAGVGVDTLSGTIPETVFMTFQMTFAIITPALMVGAFAERMKFSAMLIFMTIWMTLVYAPICHWVWGGGGWLGNKGILDFAGGTVVHINAGVAGLVAAIVLGQRKGYPTTAMPPHNLGYTLMGASMLWVGWFGFNAGSELAADGVAGMAMAVTQIATAAAALSWMFIEWVKHGKPSVLGIASGAVAGLVAITPAAGAVGPMGAMVIGFVSGAVCFVASTTLKRAMGYDDSLDVFGIHAVGGIVGAILTGVFCAESLGGAGFGGDITSIGGQLTVQIMGVGATMIYTGIVSFIILKVLDGIIGLRVTDDDESEGLDLSHHGERGYII
ncbi:MAG: ammonium transporter [Nitrospina sp.]|nr:ammonium transporter [Nitrospina sp.]MBT6718022.1 ammonium transporter [Nitrospina sp.]